MEWCRTGPARRLGPPGRRDPGARAASAAGRRAGPRRAVREFLRV